MDASAILAILLDEVEKPDFELALAGNPATAYISGVNYWEVEARLISIGCETLVPDLEKLLDRADIEIAAIDRDQIKLACAAYSRYGKGRHPARLNMGDCFAYALAKARGDKLLFKGGDFSQTDVESAL